MEELPVHPPQKRIEVVIGIVLRDGRVVICQRRCDDPLGGYWEFPGGKREPGETDEQCLVRELREELAIDVRSLEALGVIEHDYPHVRVRVQPYVCQWVSGEAQPLAADRVEWALPAELPRYRFLPANDALIRTLASRFSP